MINTLLSPVVENTFYITNRVWSNVFKPTIGMMLSTSSTTTPSNNLSSIGANNSSPSKKHSRNMNNVPDEDSMPTKRAKKMTPSGLLNMAKSSLLSSLSQKSNPYSFRMEIGGSSFSNSSTSSSSKNNSYLHGLTLQSSKIKQVHLIILVHGLWGNPLEMGYIQQSLQSQIQKQQQQQKLGSSTQFMIHSATSNEGRTNDGIIPGGKRLANEINEIIESLQQQHHQHQQQQNPAGGDDDNNGSNNPEIEPLRISLSIVGNSLGGLYARYAISEISLEPSSSVEPNIFMTTATPHLGKTRGTYVKIPRIAEKIIGKVLQPTGEDLFYDDDDASIKSSSAIIERMSIEDRFTQPLQQFKKRVAYANAYGTDLQVPTNTAAFLSDSNSVHCVVRKNKNNQNNQDSSSAASPRILLIVETPRKEKDGSSSDVDTSYNNKKNVADQMALRLDAMGWTKVFVDVRSTLFNIRTPTILRPQQETINSDDDVPTTIASSELKSLFGNHIVYQNSWSVPMGHTMMIANSKNAVVAKINEGGRPLVDAMASDLINDIIS